MKEILLLLLAIIWLQPSALAVTNQHSRLVKNNGIKQLVVDEKPWLILGGELGNSSASSPGIPLGGIGNSSQI